MYKACANWVLSGCALFIFVTCGPPVAKAAATSTISDVCANATMTPAARALHQKSALLRAYDSNCNGGLDQAELMQAEEDGYRKLSSARAAPQPKPKTTSPAPEATGATPQKTANATNSCLGATAYPFLRDSYADLSSGINPGDCLPDLKKSKGAQFSWSRDRINNNDQWSAKGVAGLRFTWLGQGANSTDPYLNYFALVPLVRFQRVTNSNVKLSGQDVDVLSPGISGEFLFNQVLDPNLELYARGRANANSDFEGHTKSWSGTFELQPVYDPLRIGTNLIVGYTYWTFSPLARFQYFSRVANSNDPLFATANNVARGGPVVALDIVPLDGDPVPPMLRNFVINMTYSWYQDFYSQRTFQLFNSSLSYNVTDNFAITLAYEKGKVDETGKAIDLTTLGLGVKY
jgi:hypothetical protein